jgi:hypothetical protein
MQKILEVKVNGKVPNASSELDSKMPEMQDENQWQTARTAK